MSITKFEANLNIIENLPDRPTLKSNELKKKFDEASLLIKKYINETLTEEIDGLITQIKSNVSKSLLEDNKKKYYVGKLVFDTKNVNPAIYLGFGTWKLWGSGKVPVGVDTTDSDFNEAEKTGGEKTHTLTASEMPRHNHGIDRVFESVPGNKNWGYRAAREYIGGNINTDNTGGNQPHNNLQPYITCYIWKRTA